MFDYLTNGGAPAAQVPGSVADNAFDQANGVPYWGSMLGWHELLGSTANTLTAHAGGGQGSATPIAARQAQFTTVATAADSAVLPSAAVVKGRVVYVANAGANSMNVFPATGDQINALGANTAFALAAGKNASFFSPKVGQWYAVLSA